MRISKQIVSARKAKGFTQQTLADRTNLALSTIKRIENAKVNPRIHTLSILSDILEIDLLPKDAKTENKLEIILISILLLFIPPINIIYLLKSKPNNKEIVNKLLIFQVSSFILGVIFLFAILTITYMITGQKIYGQINTPQILYLSFIIFNVFTGLSLLKRKKTPKSLLNYNN